MEITLLGFFKSKGTSSVLLNVQVSTKEIVQIWYVPTRGTMTFMDSAKGPSKLHQKSTPNEKKFHSRTGGA